MRSCSLSDRKLSESRARRVVCGSQPTSPSWVSAAIRRADTPRRVRVTLAVVFTEVHQVRFVSDPTRSSAYSHTVQQRQSSVPEGTHAAKAIRQMPATRGM